MFVISSQSDFIDLMMTTDLNFSNFFVYQVNYNQILKLLKLLSIYIFLHIYQFTQIKNVNLLRKLYIYLNKSTFTHTHTHTYL